MSVTFVVDHEKRKVFAKAEGTITLEQIKRHLEEERLKNGISYGELIDARAAVTDLSATDVRAVVALLRSLAERSPLGPTAVVVDNDLSYGMLRMLEILVSDVCIVKPFRDLDA